MNGTLALQDVHVQLPIEPVGELDTQGRCRRLVFGRRRAAQEDRGFARLRANLQPSNLLLSCLRQPGNQGAARIAFDQLLRGPQPLRRGVGLDPDELPLIEAQESQAGEVRTLGGPHDDDAFAGRHDAFQGRREEPPLAHPRLGLKHLGDRVTGPPGPRELCVELRPAAGHGFPLHGGPEFAGAPQGGGH